MDKLIITAAVVGSRPKREHNPHIPYSPEEIADEILRSYDAGAAIAHVHVRDPETGVPSTNLDYFRAVRDHVRSRCDILLNFTTSGLNVDADDYLEQRVSPTILGPELCSLDISSMNLGGRVFLNPPEWGPYCAKIARERGVKPEVECFDSGHIRLAQGFIDKGLLDAPYLFQLCMGTHGGVGGTMKDFVFMTELLPQEETVWTAMGVGPYQFPIAIMAILSGGHVRVGFEDNLYVSKGVLAKSNAELVDKAARLARDFGRDIAGPAEARRILRLKN